MLINDEATIIVFDTNVLLHLYLYSPDYLAFALSCLEKVKDKIVLPCVVKYEYEKHYKKLFNQRKKYFGDCKGNIKKQLENSKSKISTAVDILKKSHFPDISQYEASVSHKIDELIDECEEYFEQATIVNLVNEYTSVRDSVFDFYRNLTKMAELQYSVIYQQCQIANRRFANEIPPGFKDKNKEGLEKYNDYLLWWETLRYAKCNNTNVIFVTDDVKRDWWENSGTIFHHKLVEEFESETHKQIIGYQVESFLHLIAKNFNIQVPPIVELALNFTASRYIEDIKDSVFEEAFEKMQWNIEKYVDWDCGHFGSQGLDDDVELGDYNFIGYERIDNIYYLTFSLDFECYSYEYNGRDDDTKDVILSNRIHHRMQGKLEISIERKVEEGVDFETDNSFQNLEIYSCNFEETNYFEEFDEDDYNIYGTCPDCGCQITDDNYGGNGFCCHCAYKH